MITKQQKSEILSDLTGRIKDSKSLVFVKFNKLSVADANALRRGLKKENVGYKVAKKTLLKKAMAGENFSGEMPPLEGEIAIAYGSDLLAPAREVFNFQKGHEENVQIVGGVFEGKFLNQAEMMAIALIPPVKTLYTQLVGILSSPMRGLVVSLDQIAKKKA
jgi:large subunit ribosomal protein L10